MTLFEVITNSNNEFRNRKDGLCFMSTKDNHCKILYFDKEYNDVRVWETTRIKNITFNEDNTKMEMETRNSTYIFIKHINSIEEELIELYVLNANLRLREAREMAKKFTNALPMEILMEIHRLNNL